ncbi:MAG: hypothetical protein FD180_1161 [Planctomycetota bacterium]|nr:MAG: hypothetical protein FD180_1161 [Planctomycetota bacterium]
MIMRTALRMVASVEGAGHALILLMRTASWLPWLWRKRNETVAQMASCAFGGLLVSLIVGMFSGMVLALQSGNTLQKWGQEELIAIVVPAAMVREMGPVMTGFILAGLVGSTMAAEVGTMSVSEEIDALEVMSINPVYFLALPRVFALALVSPLLTLFADVIGIFGGAFVGDRILGLSYTTYIKHTMDTLELKDIYSGLLKAVVFGILISGVGCSQGMRARGGAEGVGNATMRTVVISFVFILVFDYILTWAVYQ